MGKIITGAKWIWQLSGFLAHLHFLWGLLPGGVAAVVILIFSETPLWLALTSGALVAAISFIVLHYLRVVTPRRPTPNRQRPSALASPIMPEALGEMSGVPSDIAERLAALERIAKEQQDIEEQSARRAKASQYLAAQIAAPLPKPSKISSHGYGGARMQIMAGLERQLIEMGVDASTIEGIKSSIHDTVMRDAQYLTYGPGDEKHWDNAVEKREYTIMSMQRDALLNIMKGFADGTSA